MKISKTSPVSNANTLLFSSILFSFAVCFMGLIHVEIELHAHRQMLRVLTEQREGKFELRNTVAEHDENVDSVFKMLHNDSEKGEWMLSVIHDPLSINCVFAPNTWFVCLFVVFCLFLPIQSLVLSTKLEMKIRKFNCAKYWKTCKQQQRKVLLNSFHYDGHTLGYFIHGRQKIEPPCTT